MRTSLRAAATLGWLVALASLSGADAPEGAEAAGGVTTCTEAAFDAAIAGGGHVTFACSGTITFTSTKHIAAGTVLTIDGVGRSINLSGANAVRHFVVSGGGSLTLRNLVLSNGKGAYGGAISVEPSGMLDATAVVFSRNVSDGDGGAIHSNGSTVIDRSHFSENAGSSGGAIAAPQGDLRLARSNFEGNTAAPGLGGFGGAILIGSGSARITGSTFYANTAGGGSGGALGLILGTVTIDNSTFAQNSAVHGGAIASFGTLSLAHVTVAANSASTFGGLSNGVHGGISNNDPRQVTMVNSLLANNLPLDCGTNKAFTDFGGNLIEDGSCGLPKGGDPMLGPLEENGGPTRTMALPRTSPAFGIGAPTGCSSAAPGGAGGVDQRGFPRVTCSAGAYEPLPDLTIRKFAPAVAGDRIP